MLEGNPRRFGREAFSGRKISLENPSSVILITLTFSSRALEEREDQEDQQEKLDQRCVRYLTTTVLHILLYKFNFNSFFFLFRVTQEMMAHQVLPGRGYVPSNPFIQGHVIYFTCIHFHKGQLVIDQQSCVVCFRVCQVLRDRQVSQDQRVLL